MKLTCKDFSTSTFAFLKSLLHIATRAKRKSDHISPLHKNLQWFSITLKIKSKSLTAAYRHPAYIALFPTLTVPQTSQSSVCSLTCQDHSHSRALLLPGSSLRSLHGGFLCYSGLPSCHLLQQDFSHQLLESKLSFALSPIPLAYIVLCSTSITVFIPL